MLVPLQLPQDTLCLENNLKIQSKNKSKLWIINYSNRKLFKELQNIMPFLQQEITLENFVR